MSDARTPTLTGKVALVTGASSGIGQATARALATAGASLAIGARRTDRLDDLKSELEAEGTRVVTLHLDVTDEQACADAVAKTEKELGPVDILVNAAGLMLLGPIRDADTDDWRRSLDTNVLGTMYMIHKTIGSMVDRGTGDVINLSSVAGRVAHTGGGIYHASKWAVNGFSEALRQEVTSSGVRVTLIEPGAVATELNDQITNPDAKKSSEESYGSMRTLQAEDIGRAIVYAVTQPAYVALNEILMRPTDQTNP
ncbi:oxidoreductase [Frondihabitans sp. PAMC 28766]|uniref:SDR family NAD(P)-dependent oxidoreductase n=1 Tax=Frondihabitans sp. PAMC 28766 TaxID=1795630 RepID=UPI00078CF5D9|nr:SDR family NAD(P)-dependent oxidoreductase [Frondihabitans sp. PAMC 28766]AMM21369.1 oxidoreductase [Frondihabitans sp. PAMC 28766]